MITGKAVTLLPFDEGYLPLVRKWVNQPDVRAGTGTEGPVSDHQHARWYEEQLADPRRRVLVIGEGFGESAVPVGLVGLKNIDLRCRSAEYWIYIGEASRRRRGIASEATSLLLDFGFNRLGLHRIYLSVSESNFAAVALYRKFGFVHEGMLREHVFADGGYRGMLVFSMLEHEFRSRG